MSTRKSLIELLGTEPVDVVTILGPTLTRDDIVAIMASPPGAIPSRSATVVSTVPSISATVTAVPPSSATETAAPSPVGGVIEYRAMAIKEVAPWLTPESQKRIDAIYAMIKGEGQDIKGYTAQLGIRTDTPGRTLRSSGVELAMTHTKTESSTYGELTEGGMIRILAIMHKLIPFGSESVFMDIGSGTGKPVFCAMLMFPGIAAWVGIEYLETLVNTSIDNFKKAHRTGIFGDNHPTFVLKDATKESEFRATHVFSYDYAFGSPIRSLVHRIIDLQSPMVRVFASFSSEKKMRGEYQFEHFELRATTTAPTTGGRSHKCYIYVRTS